MNYSGKFVLRVTPETHRRLSDRALNEGVSLNALCVRLLDAGLAAQRLEPRWRKEIKAILPMLKKRFQKSLLGVALFGSQVAKEATEISDVDVLIVLDQSTLINRSLYRRWEDKVDFKTSIEISPHFVHLPSNKSEFTGFWFEIALNHEILYQKQGCLDKTLRQVKRVIDEGQVVREWCSGHPYWVWIERGAS